jgi:hypothetical protein
MANFETQVTITAKDKASDAIKKMGKSLQDFKKSAASLSASYGAMGSAASDFGRRMRNVGFAVAAASTGIYAIVKSYSDLGETLSLTSQKTGVSIANLQKLGYAAELNKVSADELRMSLQFLNRNMAIARANPKSAQAEMFRGLGIQITKTTKAYDVLMQISDKFAKNKNVSEKNAVARTALGRPGVNLMPVLNLGSIAIKELGEEYARLGHVMSDDAAQAADDFGDNLQRLEVASKGLFAVFAEQLVPILDPLITQFTTWVASNKELVSTNVTEFLKGTVEVFKALRDVFKSVSAALRPLIEQLGGLSAVVKGLAYIYVATLVVSFAKLGIAVVVFYTHIGIAAVAAWAAVPAFTALAAASFMAALPILGIVTAIGLIGFALYKLITNFDEYKQAWFELWDSFKLKMTEFFQWIKGFAGSVMSALGDAFKSAGAASIASMNPLLSLLMSVANVVLKIKEGLFGISSKPINLGVTAPAAGTPATTASSVTAPTKTAALTAPIGAGQFASAQSARTKLDVYMKIDSEGKAKNVKAKSNSNLDFSANTGLMI